MKLAIIGSRSIKNLDLSEYIKHLPEVIISGGAKGVDSIAEQYAKENNIPLEVFKPNYARYGRGAPLVRNKQIVEACDSVLAFHDGRSRGTIFTCKYAEQIGRPVQIIVIDSCC